MICFIRYWNRSDRFLPVLLRLNRIILDYHRFKTDHPIIPQERYSFVQVYWRYIMYEKRIVAVHRGYSQFKPWLHFVVKPFLSSHFRGEVYLRHLKMTNP